MIIYFIIDCLGNLVFQYHRKYFDHFFYFFKEGFSLIIQQ
jgi:hypothetical protein